MKSEFESQPSIDELSNASSSNNPDVRPRTLDARADDIPNDTEDDTQKQAAYSTDRSGSSSPRMLDKTMKPPGSASIDSAHFGRNTVMPRNDAHSQRNRDMLTGRPNTNEKSPSYSTIVAQPGQSTTYPDTPLPPALQAQFFARFQRPPPRTHGQLQHFLRAAAQAQATMQPSQGGRSNELSNPGNNSALPGVTNKEESASEVAGDLIKGDVRGTTQGGHPDIDRSDYIGDPDRPTAYVSQEQQSPKSITNHQARSAGPPNHGLYPTDTPVASAQHPVALDSRNQATGLLLPGEPLPTRQLPTGDSIPTSIHQGQSSRPRKESLKSEAETSAEQTVGTNQFGNHPFYPENRSLSDKRKDSNDNSAALPLPKNEESFLGDRPEPSSKDTGSRPVASSHTSMALQFYTSLRQYHIVKRVKAPAELFVMQPADPNISGSSPTPPGALDVFGKKVDLLRLYVGVMQTGGFVKASSARTWARIAASMGIPFVLPAPYPIFTDQSADDMQSQSPRTTQSAEELLSNIYEVFLLGFEEHTRKSQFSSAQQQQQEGTSISGVTASPRLADNTHGDSRQVAKTSSGSNSPGSLEDGSRSRTSELPVMAVSYGRTNDGEAARPVEKPVLVTDTSRSVLKPADLRTSQARLSARPDADTLALRQRLLLQAQQKAMFQGVQGQSPKSETSRVGSSDRTHSRDVQSDLHVATNSSSSSAAASENKGEIVGKRKTSMDSSELLAAFDSKPIASDVQFNEGYEVGPSTPPSKRVRYRVEYAPYHRDLETYGGWDLRTIVKETEWSDQSRECLMVDDLGQVDIESLCMSVRSRLQSEVTYALTVLDMLSMPGKGEDKGGLGLMHCGDLLSDLVDLVEEEAFGEGGWMAWISTNEGMRQSDNSSLANSHQALLDISAEQDVLPVLFGNRGELECRAETVLVAVNLLRNFSLMNDNHPILVKHPRFMEVMLRVCDLRLAFTVKDVVSSLRVSDVLRLREDVLDILHGLSANIDLGLLPHDATEALFDLLLSHLRDCQSGNVLERLLAGSTDEMDLSERPRLALEVLSQLSSTDHNRRILRLLPADKLLDAFFTCLRYLAFNSPDIAVICTQPGALDVQGKLAVCLYNLAFLAPLQIRTVIREQTGVMMTISLALQIHGNLPPHPSYGLILRRLGETIGVLNGPDDLVGEGRILTFGANASARGLRGLQDSKTLVAPGILAQREDQLLFDMLQTGRRSGDLDQVAFGELTRAIWAI